MRTPKKIRMAALAEAGAPAPRSASRRERRGIFAGWLGTRGHSDAALETMADDAVDAWHASGPDVTEELHEWLGLTWEEYGSWATASSSIGDLLRMRAASTIVDM